MTWIEQGGGQNTESFDPNSTLVRPDLRILIGPNRECYGRPLRNDDIVVVPNYFCEEDDWTLYYQLVKEMRNCQAQGVKGIACSILESAMPSSSALTTYFKTSGAEWISWAEGAHLISQNPSEAPTFNMVQAKISKYFNIPPVSVGTRFNW